MKKLSILIFSFCLVNLVNAQDTFSICAIDTLTGEVGSAGASCIGAPQIPQGCYILSDVIPGVGVIHTQAYYTAGNQNYAHALMIEGIPPAQMVDSLVAHDIGNNPTIRQYGIVDFYTGVPRTAAYTGINCDDYKNHIIGPNYTIQGNILLGQQILDSMEARFLATEGELACKLMAALQGARVIGADTRCLDDGVSSLSSFLRVAKPDDPANDLYLDLNVPSTPVGIDPIDSLQILIDNWGSCLVSSVNNEPPSQLARFYPNPTGEILNIDVNRLINHAVIIEIFSVTGKKLLEREFNSNKIQIKHGLESGLYFCRINQSEVYKILIR
ncbi:MAG: DUF1028 domain-containing protein [Bacteroidetes bacterium]|nr:DUF1028 domain-containing protein [Bacteroidota bacterium]